MYTRKPNIYEGSVSLVPTRPFVENVRRLGRYSRVQNTRAGHGRSRVCCTSYSFLGLFDRHALAWSRVCCFGRFSRTAPKSARDARHSVVSNASPNGSGLRTKRDRTAKGTSRNTTATNVPCPTRNRYRGKDVVVVVVGSSVSGTMTKP